MLLSILHMGIVLYGTVCYSTMGHDSMLQQASVIDLFAKYVDLTAYSAALTFVRIEFAWMQLQMLHVVNVCPIRLTCSGQ